MIKLNDIKETVIKKLFDNLGDSYTYYDEEIPENFNRPSFHFTLNPTFYNRNNNFHVDKVIPCLLIYYSDDKSNLKKYDMADKLSEIMGNTLEISDRIITINEFTPIFNEDVLQFQFSINFLDSLDDKEIYEFMMNLNLNADLDKLKTVNTYDFKDDNNDQVYVTSDGEALIIPK